jgi:hypothetical protein
VSVMGMTPPPSRARIDRVDLVYYAPLTSMGKRVRERPAGAPFYTRFSR